MKTVWQEDVRGELLERASRVTRESAPLWGTMTAPKMLAHLSDALKMALGELTVARRSGPLRFPPLRHAIIHWLPFPKGAPSAPELLARTTADLGGEVAALRELLDRFAARRMDGAWAEHPAFGALSGADWGALAYKHMNHHLRQFGV